MGFEELAELVLVGEDLGTEEIVVVGEGFGAGGEVGGEGVEEVLQALRD